MELDTTRVPWWERSETRAARWGGLLVALAVVSVLHYTTSPEHAGLHVLYQRLYYGPIVVGAYWFGIWGGVVTAVAAALAYAPHIHHTWADNAPYTFSQYSELVIFVCAGSLVGFLADVQRRLTRQYRDVAASLVTTNRELKDSHAQLTRADRLAALGQIAAGLAHEIRNPLAGIKGALDIIVSKVSRGTPEAEFAAIASTEVERLNELVQEFLSYARPHAPELRPARLHDVVEHVVLLLRPEMERAGVTLEHQALEPLLETYMDPEQIRQVLFNVVLNGIQASPSSGEIRIATFRSGNHAVVEVTDQGPGIPPDHLAHIFDPFFTTKTHGTGLGLAISQRIIEAHWGEIDVRNAAGGGAVVRVALPLSAGGSNGDPSQGARP
jgi:two-component system sensor histidine kinase HydH